MKKTFKMIIFSCLVGGTLAACFFFSIKEEPLAKGKNIVYAFQVGVFEQEKNAINAMKNYSSIKMFKDKDYYRLFIGVTTNNIDILKNYFSKYDVYIKEIIVSEEEYNELAKYDELLKKSNAENYNGIIQNMLEVLNSELQN